MHNLNIRIAQMKILPGKIENNVSHMLQIIEESKKENIDLLIFPACSLTGSNVGSYVYQEEFWQEAELWRKKLLDSSENIAILWGDAANSNFSFQETAYLAQNGEFILPQNQLYKLANPSIAIQVLLADQATSEESADLTIHLAHHPFRKNSSFSPEQEAENIPSHYVYLNSVGVEDQGGIINILSGGSGYKEKGKTFVQAFPYFEERILTLTESHTIKAIAETESMEKLYQALRHSAQYYLEHLGIKKIVIGLSGGIDSAMSACIYRSILPPENLILVNMPSRFNSNTTKGIAAHMATHLQTWYGVMPIEEAVQSTIAQFQNAYFERPGVQPLHIELSSLNIENLQARIRSNRILASLSSACGGVFTCNGNKSEIIVGYGTLYGDDAGFFALLGDLWKTEIYELAQYLKNRPYPGDAIPEELFTTPPSAELSEKQAVEEGLGDPIHYSYHDRLFSAFMERLPNATPLVILQWYKENILEDQLQIPKGTIKELFPTSKEFIEDLEYWWKQYTGLSVAKRIQGAPILALSDRAFGLFPESQISWTFSSTYKNLRKLYINER